MRMMNLEQVHLKGGGGVFIGINMDATEIQNKFGNRKIELLWVVIKNKIQSIHKDSLYLPAHDTIDYEIFY